MALEPESVAVCFLHAYRHPEHEQPLGEALEDTTSTSASQPPGRRHVPRVRARGHDRARRRALPPARRLPAQPHAAGAATPGCPSPSVMQSSGGLASLEQAADHAVLTVLSGPAGGAAGAAWAAHAAGEPDTLCFDMGGTSCDVCVVLDGEVREASGREVGGRPVALPMLDIHTVGAGGGSIAWRDTGGALRVGPAIGRRAARPRRVRPRRRGAHGDRRQPPARAARRDRGRDRARPRGGRSRPWTRLGEQLGLNRAGDRRGDHPGRQRRDGPRAARDDRRARRRPARARADGLRRRRRAARGGDRRGARDHEDPLPAGVGRARRARPGRLRAPPRRAAQRPAQGRRADRPRPTSWRSEPARSWATKTPTSGSSPSCVTAGRRSSSRCR